MRFGMKRFSAGHSASKCEGDVQSRGSCECHPRPTQNDICFPANTISSGEANLNLLLS
jgi:hypothetical protein